MFRTTNVTPFLEFILATENLKLVERRTSVIGSERRENSAEHSWQVALLAIVLKDLSNEVIDINRVIKMLLVHDLPEIIAGDTFFYSTEREGVALHELSQKERLAAKELFSSLPNHIGKELYELWDEYENCVTSEARFAHALDRIVPGLQNYFSNGGTWKEFCVSLETAQEKNVHVREGSLDISEFIYVVLEEAQKKGLFGA